MMIPTSTVRSRIKRVLVFIASAPLVGLSIQLVIAYTASVAYSSADGPKYALLDAARHLATTVHADGRVTEVPAILVNPIAS